jgi:hypothetical protein
MSAVENGSTFPKEIGGFQAADTVVDWLFAGPLERVRFD